MIQRTLRHRTTRLVMLLCFVAACGASSRTKTLRVNLVALNTARDSVLVLSKEREKQLYASCNPPSCSKEEGHTRVDAWRAKIDVAIKAIDVGYNAVHDAALLDDTKSTTAAVAAAAKALDLYKKLKETP
jgi:hypothetical protein